MIKARKIRCEGHVALMADGINACNIFGRKLEIKRPLGILEN
jgi:hypothetical protein